MTIARHDPAMTGLDNVTLAGKEGWNRYVNTPKRQRPEELSHRQIRNLSEDAADAYLVQRCEWHTNMRFFKTPQSEEIQRKLSIILEADTKDGWRTRDAVAIDGNPGLGKSQTLFAVGRAFQQKQIKRYGEDTEAGDQRIPVIRIGMRGNTGITAFSRAVCDFCAHPGRRPTDVDEYSRRALHLVRLCETRLLIVDDIHFLHWQRDGGIEINNHFKFIANEFPVTIVMIGIGITERGLLQAGTVKEPLAQTARNTTTLNFPAYTNRTARGRHDWAELLVNIEGEIVLAHTPQGFLLEHADYLFKRTTGHIGSLMTLVRRGCAAAILDGSERLTKKLLDSIEIDSAAERAYNELQQAHGSNPRAKALLQQYENLARAG